MNNKPDWGAVAVIAFWVLFITFALWVGSQPTSQLNANYPQCEQYGNC